MRSKTWAMVIIAVFVLSVSAASYYSLVYAPSLRADTVGERLYFTNRDATRVVAERRTIAGEVTGERIIGELIKGPTSPNLIATIPTGTRLLSFWVEERIAFVNFSREVVENYSGGSASELMLVYSVIASLTELPEIAEVQFLVEGRIETSIWGHLDTSLPLPPDEQFIAR